MSTAVAAMPSPFAFKAVTTVQGGDIEVCPAGNKGGVLVAVVHFGTFNEEFTRDDKSTYYKDVHKIGLFWQLPDERRKNGEPFIIGERYLWAPELGGRSALRKLLEGWNNRKYGESDPDDPSSYLLKPGLVNVIHARSRDGSRTYANFNGVTELPAGMPTPKATRSPLLYHMSMGDPPDLSWLPYLYGQRVEAIMSESKERSGKPVHVRPATAADGPAAQAGAGAMSGPSRPTTAEADRRKLVRKVERLLEDARDTPTPKQGPAFDEAMKLMRENGIQDEDLSEECSDQLVPF